MNTLDPVVTCPRCGITVMTSSDNEDGYCSGCSRVITTAAAQAGHEDGVRFHATFDSNVRDIMGPVRTALLESTESCTREEIIGQLLMEFIADDGFTGDDPDSYFAGRFTLHQKQNLMAVAEHMGPDWAQALYHAAVFVTKVA